MNDTNNASERMISLRQNEVLILVKHYETLAVQLEETATRYEKSVRDEFLESAWTLSEPRHGVTASRTVHSRHGQTADAHTRKRATGAQRLSEDVAERVMLPLRF